MGRLGGYWGADVGWLSGEEALVVPDQNEGTGEIGEEMLGLCSHSVMAIDGSDAMLPAEKLPRSISFAPGVNDVGKAVSRVS